MGFSLGIHIDYRRPYVDFHLGVFIVSIGHYPAYTPEAEARLSFCRGGIIGE